METLIDGLSISLIIILIVAAIGWGLYYYQKAKNEREGK
jgi:uncharacterized protein HemX